MSLLPFKDERLYNDAWVWPSRYWGVVSESRWFSPLAIRSLALLGFDSRQLVEPEVNTVLGRLDFLSSTPMTCSAVAWLLPAAVYSLELWSSFYCRVLWLLLLLMLFDVILSNVVRLKLLLVVLPDVPGTWVIPQSVQVIHQLRLPIDFHYLSVSFS